jgi:hypothetical protein
MSEKIRLTALKNLFDIMHGNKMDLNKMVEFAPGNESVAFVGRSGEANGIVAFVERVDGIPPYQAGLITVALGGSALSSFVQPREFYTAQNIDVLSPKRRMSFDVKLYYCLCVEANRFRYSTFGREANRTLKELMVPTLESIPAWVEGTGKLAVKELNRDLSSII